MNRPFNKVSGIFIVLAAVLQVAWYGLLGSRMVSDLQLLKSADFSILYTGGRAANMDYAMVYDIETQRRVQSDLLGRQIQTAQLLPFNHPPLLLPVQQLAALFDYRTAYLLWDAIMLLCIAAAGFMLRRLLLTRGWERGAAALIPISGMLFYPLFISLLKGQDTSFLLLGATLLICGLAGESDPLAGIGLAAMIIRPQIALALGIPFLFRRRRVLGWAAIAGLVPLATVLALGAEGIRSYVDIVLVTARGQGFNINQSAMFNLLGLLTRSLPESAAPFIQPVTWIGFGLAIAGLCIGWRRTGGDPLGYFGIAIILSLFFSPHLHYHDLALLLLPAIILSVKLTEAGVLRASGAGAALAALSIFLLFVDVVQPLRFIGTYLVMALLGVLIAFPGPVRLKKSGTPSETGSH